MRRGLGAGLLTAVVLVTGCGGSGGSGGSGKSSHNAVDVTFVRDMLVHHERALQLGQLAATHGTDPRVRAFGRRILKEQTPEKAHLEAWVTTVNAKPDPATDRRMASGYVSDSSYAQLMHVGAAVFDRQVLLLSASSEDGAVQMAEVELHGGSYQPALTLARSISGAHDTEIPELRKLAAGL